MSEDTFEKETGINREGKVLKGSRIVPLFMLGLALLLFLTRGIDWEDFSRVGSASFLVGESDFTSIDKLVEKLEKPERSGSEDSNVSRFVWGQIADKSKNALSSNTTPQQLKEEVLVKELNDILECGYSIYSKNLFPGDLSGYELKIIQPGGADSSKAPEGLPAKGEKLVAVANGNKLKIRIFGSDGTPLDYGEDDIPNRYGELKDLKSRLNPDSPPENSVKLEEVTSLLGYTGLSPNIDREKKLRAQIGGDTTLLNRLLLEHEFPDEIRKNSAKDNAVGIGKIFGGAFKSSAQAFASDVPVFVWSQLKIISVLALCALIPGVAGLIYRRAFWLWFLASFAILYAFNWMSDSIGWGAIGADVKDDLNLPYTFYQWIQMVLVLLVVAYGFRRHSGESIDAVAKKKNILLGLGLILLTVLWIGSFFADIIDYSWWQFGTISLLLMIGGTIISQALKSAAGRDAPTKNIVVCLDGTWNEPGQKDFGYLAWTNVFKIYKMLKGAATRKHYNASQSKEYLDEEGFARQIGFYYHGVGNKVENSKIGQVIGGAFGMGADAIVERAYLDVVRVYRPGDRIFIFGFSRGAAIARLVAGVIGRRGVPLSLWTLRLFGLHRSVWKSSRKIERPDGEKEKVREGKAQNRPYPPVEVLGCWDTVGAFGISKDILGIPFQKMNLLKDLNVSLCVKRAYHMVALDEMRDSFEPTLMEPDPTDPDRIVEVWFSGNHSNIGGGYATDRLSDVTLDFLLRHLSSGYAFDSEMKPGNEAWGLYLSAIKWDPGIAGEGEAVPVLNPDPLGQLRQSSGAVYSYAPRKLPIHAVIYGSVFERMKNALPVYAPQSLFDLNEELVKKRKDIEEKVTSLEKTHAISSEDRERIQTWSQEKISLIKWPDYEQTLKDSLNPAEELAN